MSCYGSRQRPNQQPPEVPNRHPERYRSVGHQQAKSATITYRRGVWKTLYDYRRLNKGWEPLRSLPIAVTRARYLSDSCYDRAETCLRGGELEDTFGDPFGFAVTVT